MKGHFTYGLFECIEWEIIGVLGSVVRSESYSSKLLHRVTIYLRTKGYVNLDFDTDIEAHKAHSAVSEAIKRNVKLSNNLNFYVGEINHEGNI